MKKLIVAFTFLFMGLSVFAGELDGTFENGATKITMTQSGSEVSGNLLSNGQTYVLSGKVENGIAYIEVINNSQKLMGNIMVRILSNGEMVVNVQHTEHDFGVANATKLIKK